jgi:hypothetical protein
VIATSAKVELKGLDEKTLEKVSESDYFTKEKKSQKAKGEEAFFKQGEKPEVNCSYVCQNLHSIRQHRNVGTRSHITPGSTHTPTDLHPNSDPFLHHPLKSLSNLHRPVHLLKTPY